MPFPLKIQPIDFTTPVEPAGYESAKPVAKSRFRWFERRFASVLMITASEKVTAAIGGDEKLHCSKEVSDDFEPSSVCLANMVQNFIEERNDKQSMRCNQNRCDCLNGSCKECSDDEFESNHSSSTDSCEILKSLVPCSTVYERNLLADAARIVEKNKICKCKGDTCRIKFINGLLALGYDVSSCKSRWEKAPSYPAGEYDYVDVINEGERLIIDIDFKSEFEIARSTKAYKAILQQLPQIFVGKTDRLQKMIDVVSEAARLSLKKKGMPFPPWRKAEYVKAKWLSPYTRATPSTPTIMEYSPNLKPDKNEASIGSKETVPAVQHPVSPAETDHGDTLFSMSEDEA